MEPNCWPDDARRLEELQSELARSADEIPRWVPTSPLKVGATFVASAEDRLWAAAVVFEQGSPLHRSVTVDRSRHPYVPGLLALREGPILERVVNSLTFRPDVLLVNATGRDHPRGAGLALHLGAILDLATIGVTDRPLVAEGPLPGPSRGSSAPLSLGGRVVGARLRTRTIVRPVCVHAAWRTDPDTACALLRELGGRVRTPRPLREARRLARAARGQARSADRRPL